MEKCDKIKKTEERGNEMRQQLYTEEEFLEEVKKVVEEDSVYVDEEKLAKHIKRMLDKTNYKKCSERTKILMRHLYDDDFKQFKKMYKHFKKYEKAVEWKNESEKRMYKKLSLEYDLTMNIPTLKEVLDGKGFRFVQEEMLNEQKEDVKKIEKHFREKVWKPIYDIHRKILTEVAVGHEDLIIAFNF